MSKIRIEAVTGGIGTRVLVDEIEQHQLIGLEFRHFVKEQATLKLHSLLTEPSTIEGEATVEKIVVCPQCGEDRVREVDGKGQSFVQFSDKLRLDLMEVFPNAVCSTFGGYVNNSSAPPGPFQIYPTLREALNAAILGIAAETVEDLQARFCNSGAINTDLPVERFRRLAFDLNFDGNKIDPYFLKEVYRK